MSYATNKDAHRNYEILKKYTAGVLLRGFEVKSIRAGHINISGSHITINEHNQVFLLSAHIAPYQPNNTPDSYDPSHQRKLLLTKKEIRTIKQDTTHKGLTLIPLKVYNSNNNIKVEIALVRGKKKYDKRHKIRLQDTVREIGTNL